MVIPAFWSQRDANSDIKFKIISVNTVYNKTLTQEL